MRKQVITRKLIYDIKRHLKQNWHDQAWHDYNTDNFTLIASVQYAMSVSNPGDTWKDLQKEAMLFLCATAGAE